MSATRIQTPNEQLFLEDTSVSNHIYTGFEPLEEEFQPGGQSVATNVIMLVSSAIVICLVAVFLGWKFGIFLAMALVAKIVIARIEGGKVNGETSSDHQGRTIAA